MLYNYGSGSDCGITLEVLRQLGVRIDQNRHEVSIQGKGLFGFDPVSTNLFCGNSGTTARLLAGILAGQPFLSRLLGDASLSGRPMERVAEPLRRMGASITTSREGTLPMTVEGHQLKPLDFTLEIPSAQVKSAVLLAGLLADGTTIVRERRRTRDHTERLLPSVRVEENGGGRILSVEGGRGMCGRNLTIPGDLSSAAFLIAASLLRPGSELVVRDVGLNPTRTYFLEVLKRMGAEISTELEKSSAPEPCGTLTVKSGGGGLGGAVLSGEEIPLLIDEIPAMAVLGTACDGGLEVRDAGELRLKECDRIRAITENLRAMGVKVDEWEDGFRVHPGRLRGGRVRTFGDHRVAMAMTVAAMGADGKTTIDDMQCVEVSFPEFLSLLDSDRSAELN